MIIDLNLDVSGLNPAIFSKGTDPKQYTPEELKLIEAYGTAFAEWEKTKIGEAPQMPQPPHFTPIQVAASFMKRAIYESHKVGNTGHLRHIIRLSNDIDAQTTGDSKAIVLPESDVHFIRKQYANVEWNLEKTPGDLLKFILLVEDAIKTAKAK